MRKRFFQPYFINFIDKQVGGCSMFVTVMFLFVNFDVTIQKLINGKDLLTD